MTIPSTPITVWVPDAPVPKTGATSGFASRRRTRRAPEPRSTRTTASSVYSAAVLPSGDSARCDRVVVQQLRPTGGQVDQHERRRRPSRRSAGSATRPSDERRCETRVGLRAEGSATTGPPAAGTRYAGLRRRLRRSRSGPPPSSPDRGSPRSGRTGGRPSAGAGPARPGADRRCAARRRTRCPRRAPRRRPRRRAASGGPAGAGAGAARVRSSSRAGRTSSARSCRATWSRSSNIRSADVVIGAPSLGPASGRRTPRAGGSAPCAPGS